MIERTGGEGIAKPCPFAISWTHSPVASKLGVALRAKLRKLFTFAIPWA